MGPWIDPDTHGWVHNPSSDSDWEALLQRFGGLPNSPLARVLEVARQGRCRSIIEENRYVDVDYRSEYSAFWSERFPSRPAFGRRLHFFRKSLSEGTLDRLPTDPGYLGYTVLKPIEPGRVGRTMLAPPRRLAKATLALATDRVSLFGTTLSVTGAPFCEQDGEYLRCAHAAIWMCHYAASRRGLVGRQATASLVEMSPSTLSHERALPSAGLTLNQIQAIFATTGQPALFYGVNQLPSVEGVDTPIPEETADGQVIHPGFWDTRIFSVLCRYLNAGFPVLVGTLNHAFVVVGWYRDKGRIRYVLCDDQVGPYEVVQSPFTDRRAPWNSIMVPLPPKVYMSGETAETTTHFLIRAHSARRGAPQPWKDLADGIANGSISLRTFLRANGDYKASVAGQGRPREATRALRLARLPHWVWVTEAQDRGLRAAGEPAVRAEMVFDSTSSDQRAAACAITLPGLTLTVPPDSGKAEAAPSGDPWKSHLPN